MGKILKRCYCQTRAGSFKKVTRLSVKDFELLVSFEVFNSNLMNDADLEKGKIARYKIIAFAPEGSIVIESKILEL